jgi:hypothetical protein
MALSASCPTCNRTVYIAEGDTPICPVCSSPLLREVELAEPPPEAGPVDQMEGTK